MMTDRPTNWPNMRLYIEVTVQISLTYKPNIKIVCLVDRLQNIHPIERTYSERQAVHLKFFPFWIQLHLLSSLKISCSPSNSQIFSDLSPPCLINMFTRCSRQLFLHLPASRHEDHLRGKQERGPTQPVHINQIS